MLKKHVGFMIIMVALSGAAIFCYLDDGIGIYEALSVCVLAATAYVIAKQAWATQEIAQGKPAVDVSVIFDKSAKRTIIQFVNVSKTPALIWLKVKVTRDRALQNDPSLKGNDYLMGRKAIDLNSIDTGLAPSSDFGKEFFENLVSKLKNNADIELILCIYTAPAGNRSYRSLFQTKSYRFDKDKEDWIRMPFWGIAERDYRIK